MDRKERRRSGEPRLSLQPLDGAPARAGSGLRRVSLRNGAFHGRLPSRQDRSRTASHRGLEARRRAAVPDVPRRARGAARRRQERERSGAMARRERKVTTARLPPDRTPALRFAGRMAGRLVASHHRTADRAAAQTPFLRGETLMSNWIDTSGRYPWAEPLARDLHKRLVNTFYEPPEVRTLVQKADAPD